MACLEMNKIGFFNTSWAYPTINFPTQPRISILLFLRAFPNGRALRSIFFALQAKKDATIIANAALKYLYS